MNTYYTGMTKINTFCRPIKEKAGATNPAVEQLIIEEIKQEQIADDKPVKSDD